MSRSIVEIAIAAAAALVFATSALAAPRQVLYVGDSLGVGTTPGFARALGSSAQVRGDSRVGRPSQEGLGVLRQEFTPADDVVVFDLGTNDDPARPALLASDLAAARAAAGSACLVVATLNRPPLNGYNVAGLNQAVERFAGSAPNVQLVDWHAYVASDPGLLGPDRVHPTPQGYAIRAQLFAQAVAGCGSAAAPAAPRATHRRAPRAVPKPKPKPHRPPLKVPGIESSGISFSVPLRVRRASAQLLLPNSKPPYPAVVVAGGPAAEPDVLAAAGVAVLSFDRAAGADDVRAAVGVLRARREIERGRVALWGGTSAAPVAAGNRGVAAVVAIDPAVLPSAEVRDWRIRRAVDAPAVTTWLRLRSRGERTDAPWRRVAQPLFAAWPRSGMRPARAEARALLAQLEAGPNRDRTFGSYATEQQATSAGARWLAAHLTAKPVAVTDTPLPPAQGGPRPVQILGASAIYSWPAQIAWLAIPALLLALGLARARAVPLADQGRAPLADQARAPLADAAPGPRAHPLRSIGLPFAAGLAALAAIAGGVAAVLDSNGRGVATIAGLPWPFALAWLFVAFTAAAGVALLARRAYLAALGALGWLALALFWLL